MNIPKYDANGNCILNESYKEILVLDKMLTDAGIPHTLRRFMDGYQLLYPSDEKPVMDAIEHFGSYGNEQDMLEIMGLLTPEEVDEIEGNVLGYLTAEEVFVRIQNHYLGIKPKKKRKYHKGELITSVSELIDQELIYVGNKPTHKGWFMSWQLRYAKNMIDRGVLFKAVKEE